MLGDVGHGRPGRRRRRARSRAVSGVHDRHPTSQTGRCESSSPVTRCRSESRGPRPPTGSPAGPGAGAARSTSPADPLRFQVDDEHRFALRPMTEGDLGDVTRWVNTPHVARWWDEHRSRRAGRGALRPGIRGEDAVRYWVWEVNGRSVGFCQDYRIADHPDYALLCGHPDAVGFDYVIGEAPTSTVGWAPACCGCSCATSSSRRTTACGSCSPRPTTATPARCGCWPSSARPQGLWFDEPQSDGRVDTVVGCSIDVRRVLG